MNVLKEKKNTFKEINEDFLAGQRLILGFNGLKFNNDLKHIIANIKACGIILFKRNIESFSQVKTLCKECQDYALECGLPPLFISIDQEGGKVARLQKPFTIFKGNPFIETAKQAKDFAFTVANELKEIGVNMNFAPVLDVVFECKDSIMKDRAFKKDAKNVSKLGISVIKTMQKQGIMAVAKHFPGIGRTIKDSHFSLPVLDIDLKMLEQSDLIPFVDAKNQKVAGIMLSHIFYPKLDKKWQASLSPFIANNLLRKKIGYNGLVITDDLDMKAIEHEIETCMKQILTSKIDIALICHKGPDIDKAFQEIKRLIAKSEDLFIKSLESVKRILKYKEEFL